MLRQIDRRPARVEGYHRRIERLKLLDPATERVENVERLHVDCFWRTCARPRAARASLKAAAPKRARPAIPGRACARRQWLCIGDRPSMRNPEDTTDKRAGCAGRPAGAGFH